MRENSEHVDIMAVNKKIGTRAFGFRGIVAWPSDQGIFPATPKAA